MRDDKVINGGECNPVLNAGPYHLAIFLVALSLRQLLAPHVFSAITVLVNSRHIHRLTKLNHFSYIYVSIYHKKGKTLRHNQQKRGISTKYRLSV